MNKIHIIGLFSTIFLFSCGNEPNKDISAVNINPNSETQNITVISNEVALDRLSNNCFACHNPNSESHDDILAPPLAGIKHKYKKHYPNEQEFITQMTEFVDSPTKEEALMKGPVKRFGVMPKTALSKKEVQELVQYIYNNEIESPEWFEEHFEEKHGK
ncbi:c-type cytochrome [Brumimicrobium glaciale]|uniref:C-type cytochrome n=1 Tax=Brumimicrobium glaciale TaxID=200475 RepID=A0A4Q4KMM2_9FLAO|nr:c-type cytochrome [Brumimicrobium glaciale]RYM34663.1 c-type cytochrome [Brumimicrobium glaciale]